MRESGDLLKSYKAHLPDDEDAAPVRGKTAAAVSLQTAAAFFCRTEQFVRPYLAGFFEKKDMKGRDCSEWAF